MKFAYFHLDSLFPFFSSMAIGFGFLSSTSPAIKWLGFVTAVWVQAVAGNNYTFSNYSDALKSLMSLSQLQLNNLSVAKDVGKAFGIFSGLASDYLPTSVILIIGAVEGLIGYGTQWLVISRTIPPLPYWQVRFSPHKFIDGTRGWGGGAQPPMFLKTLYKDSFFSEVCPWNIFKILFILILAPSKVKCLISSMTADVHISLHGRQQLNMDEHSSSGDMHKKLQKQPRTSIRNLERLCRP